MISIIKAEIRHISQLAPLFDKYRIFYKQDSDIEAAKKFLQDRFEKDENTVFLALKNDIPVGFTQLYTSFSSVSMQPVYILNDLYVSEHCRGEGVGKALLEHAKAFCRETNYKGLALETAVNNPAQHLYEQLGWKKDTACFHYFWTCQS